MSKNKKFYLLAAGLLVVIAGLGLFGWLRRDSQPEETEVVRRQVVEPINVIPVEERPYIQVRPMADGRNVQIIINDLKKPALSVEYELEYQAGTLLQGAFGAIELDGLPATETILLGSCSAGGACTYHEDVRGGRLLTRFLDDEDRYVLRSDWRYFDNRDREIAVASRDAKFQLESEAIANHRYLIVFNAAGYPESPDGQLASDLYALAGARELAGEGTLSIRADGAQDIQNPVIHGWNGEEWQVFPSQVDGQMVTADVELMELYVVVGE